MHNKLIVSLVIACLIIVFMLQNSVVVEVQFLFWTLSMSRSLLVIVFVAVGMLVGWLLNSYLSFRKRHR